jgi:hypothetical protein
MGRKKKIRPSTEELFGTIARMLVPISVLEDFDIYGADEYSDRWVIEMREKEDRIPKELEDQEELVFDGYCNAIEALSHSFSTKPVYLRVYRRRWKLPGTDKHYSNQYDFTLKGVKMVPELGFFLKDED